MSRRILRWLGACLAALGSVAAHGAITCTISSNGFAAAYNPANPATTIVQTFFRVRCTKDLAGDPGSVAFSVTVDNGTNPQGVNNRATMGASTIRYDAYRNATCGLQWKGASAITGTLSTPTTGTFTVDVSFWGCIPAGASPPAGTYTDSVLMTMTYGAAPVSTTTSSFGVVITTPPVCSISTAPGTVTLNYVSFGAAANASTNFGVTCTLALPYTMALDATAGTALGLNYTLALSTSAATGTGAQQTHSISGAIAAGQSGSCATATCTASQVRSVTVTY